MLRRTVSKVQRQLSPRFLSGLTSQANPHVLTVDSPYTGDVHTVVELSDSVAAHQLVNGSISSQLEWAQLSLDSKMDICRKFVEEMQNDVDATAMDISGSMGKTFKQAKGEMNGMVERALHMIDAAPEALSDEVLPEKAGVMRKIVKGPVGVVFVIAPWNYPLLCAVNSVIPAVLAGNSVVLKHSSRTPLVANAFQHAFERAGAPYGLVQALHCDHSVTEELINSIHVGHVSFTGSVPGGEQINSAAAKRVDLETTLELGGKDPAYVAEDANLADAVATIVDGALYNAGQCCCAIERVYVHENVYDEFVERAESLFQAERLGDPMDDSTTMGPMAQKSAPTFLLDQVTDAIEKGATLIHGGNKTKANSEHGRFFEPTLLTNCHHGMDIVMEESFGPVLPVIKVLGDDDAIQKMNHSPFGLTASIFTQDLKRAETMAKQIQTGTVYMNRCDNVDPGLPWTGVKKTGKGVSLSRYGFSSYTKLKSLNFKL